ncbi:MAG: acyltransferase family protein [Limnohabitans sp.]
MSIQETSAVSRPERPAGRSFLLDLLKAIGCILIVLHHLAFYGPMSDVVAQRWPATIDWLVDHGRLAVQFFLVCSGYLTAGIFARAPQMDVRRLARLAWRRYLRLAVPLLAALGMTVLVTEWIRPDFDHASLSAVPSWSQVLAHVFLLQHLMNMEALSAGVWYVAIDFQLYLLVLLVLWAVSLWQRWRPASRTDALLTPAILVLTVFSLLHWNLNSELDLLGLYFFGSYGLGWLAWRARQSRLPPKGWVILLGLGLLALWVDPRWRIFTAWAVAMLLAVAPSAWLGPFKGHARWQGAVSGLARMSYSVFVIHFAVSLLVNAVVMHWWPQSLVWNAAGMLLALGLSLLAGAQLSRWTEQKSQDGRHWLFWVGVFIASSALAMLRSSASA